MINGGSFTGLVIGGLIGQNVGSISHSSASVNVNVGNDGRGMSYSVSGSINLNYPGVNAQDYVSWQVKDTNEGQKLSRKG